MTRERGNAPEQPAPEHLGDEHGPREGETLVLLHGNSVAGWMWTPQVELLPGRHLLTPDLPGLGRRSAEVWPGLHAVADDVARLIRERALGGRAHVVGLSLGGFVALHLLHRHPDLVRTCTISGVAAAGLGSIERVLVQSQVPLWHHRWYWAAQAFVFRIPADSRDAFAAAGAAVLPETNRRTVAEIVAGGMPRGGFDYDGPLLVVAGEREAGSVRAAFPVIRSALPQARFWVAPRMHHPWNIEDPELFTRMIVTHADAGEWRG